MVTVSFSALFSSASFEKKCQFGPVFVAVLSNKGDDCFIFFCCPGPFDKGWVYDFVPSTRELSSCLVGEKASKHAP